MGSEPLEINFEAYAYKFHENEAEIGRLERGIGKLETAHTKELLLHWLPEQTTIYDVVGGVGYYANWLAGLGHKVTMLELVPAAVEYAKSYQTSPYTALAGDVRHLPFSDHSAGALLSLPKARNFRPYPNPGEQLYSGYSHTHDAQAEPETRLPPLSFHEVSESRNSPK